MRRRRLLQIAPSLAGALIAGWTPSGAGAAPSYTVSLGQLEAAIAQRFPVRHQVEGLFNFDILTPRLSLLAQRNRMASEFVVMVAGPALRRSYTGSLDLDFALRYEPSDRTIRAHQLQVRSMRLSGLPQRSGEVLDAYAPMLAQQALHEVILHQLREKDLALADAMGLQPAAITVTSQGLVIGFEAKQPP